jgi:predicted ThiF/HesA family dinucleotide-utilizing enzyme
LTVSAAILVIAASNTFVLANPANLGTHKMKPGQYEVSVKKDQAVITNEDGKSFSVPVKIEQEAKKFGQTMVGTKKGTGSEEVSEIDLGGSTTKLVF